jgi:hypothetical protein
MINMKVTGDSVEERIEKFNSFKDHLPKYHRKGVQINVADNVTALRTREETDGTLHKEWQFTHNLVTSTGDIYYANKICLKKADGADYVDAGAAGAGFAGDGHLFHYPTTTVSPSNGVFRVVSKKDRANLYAYCHFGVVHSAITCMSDIFDTSLRSDDVSRGVHFVVPMNLMPPISTIWFSRTCKHPAFGVDRISSAR